MNDQSLSDTSAGESARDDVNVFRRTEAPTIDLDAPAMPLTVAQILDMAKLPERRAHVCLRSDLLARHDELVAELGTLVYADGTLRTDVEASLGESTAKARVLELDRQIQAVGAEMSQSMWKPLFRGISSDALAVFNKAHWPKKQGEPMTDYYNRLIAECVVEPELTLEDVQALRQKFSHRQMQSLIDAATAVNVGLGVDVPKSPISLQEQTES